MAVVQRGDTPSTFQEAPPDMPLFRKGVGEELQKAKNRCLRTVARAYKATPIQSLQTEVGVPPLPLHMDGRQARF